MVLINANFLCQKALATNSPAAFRYTTFSKLSALASISFVFTHGWWMKTCAYTTVRYGSSNSTVANFRFVSISLVQTGYSITFSTLPSSSPISSFEHKFELLILGGFKTVSEGSGGHNTHCFPTLSILYKDVVSASGIENLWLKVAC